MATKRMTDNILRVLISIGVLLQAGALGLGFTRLGWRMPMIVAGVALALGAVGVWLYEGAKIHAIGVGVAVWAVVLSALAAWHGLSDGAAAAWSYRAAFGLQCLAAGLVFWFAFFFRLNRLW